MNRDVERLTAEATEIVRRIGAHASDVATQHEAQIDRQRDRVTTLERELAAKTMEVAALREELAATKATLARALDEEVLEVVEADVFDEPTVEMLPRKAVAE